MKNESADFLPRDEFDLCLLFEEMLRTPFCHDLPMTDSQLRELEQMGILNRIFRRWVQTTWGKENWSRYFSGRTPRQELALLYPDLNSGNSSLSVYLESSNEGLKVQPLFFSHRQTSLFDSGLEQIKRHPFNFVEPFFDLGFSSFASSLNASEVATPQQFEPFFWWDIFCSQVGEQIVTHTALQVDQRKKERLVLEVQDCISLMICIVKEGADSWFNLDAVVEEIWRMFRHADKHLPPIERLFSEDFRKSDEISYGQKVLYSLGRAIDQYLFFPADRYFGAMELVWTDFQNFVQELVVIQDYLSRDRSQAWTHENPAELWYSPCTSFRFFPKFSLRQLYF